MYTSDVTPLLQRRPRRVAAEPHRDCVDPRAAARPQPRPGQPRHGARTRHAPQTLRAGGRGFLVVPSDRAVNEISRNRKSLLLRVIESS